MLIKELFQKKRAVVSFEIFPPKATTSINSIYHTIDALAPLRPDYISVTYGAGASTTKNTVEIASLIRNKYDIHALAHLTCLSSTQLEIDQILQELQHNQVNNVLALRGDLPKDGEHLNSDKQDFRYASDLVSYVKKHYLIGLAGACYPEGHPQAFGIEEDIDYLQAKVEAGVDFLITQLFFDNDLFLRFIEKVQKRNIRVPIQVGIMPVTHRKQIERIVSLSNATIPKKLIKILDRFENNQEAVKDAGIAYATEQISELLSEGVQGVHIYTMNKPQVAKDLVHNLQSLLYAVNK